MAKKIGSLADLEKLRGEILSRTDPDKRKVIVSGGTCGESRGSEKVCQAFIDEMKSQGVDGKIDLKYTGCHGFCEREPVVLILPEEICYLGVKPEDVPEIVSETLVQDKVVERLTYEDRQTGEKAVKESDIPFYKHQSRIVFGNNKLIDPKSIEDYIAIGGYEALAKALCQMTPEQVLDEVKTANIRGRG
ncbi:MAG: NAD(P)H-dependent oxidoreductase subunit E, partial [Dehalococcoidia bacterium]